MIRPKVLTICEYCHSEFYKDKYKLKYGSVCKNCNGLASSFASSKYSSKHEYFLSLNKKKLEFKIINDLAYYDCDVCGLSFSVRKDCFRVKKKTCLNCQKKNFSSDQIFIKFLSPAAGRGFFLFLPFHPLQLYPSKLPLIGKPRLQGHPTLGHPH